METKTNSTAAGILNHNQTGIGAGTTMKAGDMTMQHNETGIAVRTKVKAGFNFVMVQSKSSPTLNHNQTGIAVRTNVKAGSLNYTKITYAY